ncbi:MULTISPECIES: hypothetical protein [unclassified Corynebacterium]|uniref:hypothetical protein n=1 Tax=unclassified Corynebacterium TaxID=2624378 RepID=UPI0008A32ACD|nr:MULTISPECIES: hypothetical protein [unclassified Corynebacterium]MDK8243553.1 hypothetical protein [Corynebacterium sp. UMB10321]OFT30649.1 hypothetical protein HMPREF3170_03840 [Corynebacterium sp. HMSC08D02]
MPHQLTQRDVKHLARCLTLLGDANIHLDAAAEPADIEDAILDDLDAFREAPMTTLLGLRGPHNAPLIDSVVHSVPQTDNVFVHLLDYIALAAKALRAELREVAVFPDPDNIETGSLRLRVGEWDVTDIDIPAGSAGPAGRLGVADAELAIIGALMPLDAEAVTFQSPQGIGVVLADVVPGTPQASMQAVFTAIEAEL